MNTMVIQTRNNLIIAIATLFVYYFFSGGDAASFLPLMALCAGCGGGGGGGGGGGCGAGGDCSGAGAGGAGGDGGCAGSVTSSSTPFLCTWDGEKYCFENDFLFGKPTSLFANKSIGIAAYERGEVVGDLYKIQNLFKLKDGKPSFRIKEIEPEESYIDHMTLSHFVYNKDAELMVDSGFKSVRVFKKEALLSGEGISKQRILWNGEDVSEAFSNSTTLFENSNTEGRLIEPGKDIVEVEGKVSGPSAEAYLVLKSYYRDWTLGEIFAQAKAKNGISWREFFGSARTPGDFTKVAALMVITAFLWVSSFAGSFLRPGSSNGSVTINDAKELAALFGPQKASADTPGFFSGVGRSIVVEYWDGSSFNTLDVYSPRYYQMTRNVFRIPQVAIRETGDMRLRITATNRHRIGYIGFVAPNETTVPKAETLKVTRAFHQRESKDYASVLNSRQSGDYLHTIPADIVDVEFEAPAHDLKSDEQDSYVLASGGIYTSLSESSRAEAGDWVSKLDTDARKWLEDMNALQAEKMI